MDLWSYIVEVDSRDCDGHHHSRIDFLAVETPSEVVYDRADLFALGEPSMVRLVDGSTEESGTAYVSETRDEGGQCYTITWDRVRSPKKRDEFLAKYERNGPRISVLYRYYDLYRARLKEAVKAAYPEATHLQIRVEESGQCTIDGIGRFAQTVFDPQWSAAFKSPAFEQSVQARVDHDVHALYGLTTPTDGEYFRL